MKRFESPLNCKGTPQFRYFNDEWNPSGDEDFIDGVDTYNPPKEDTTYYDDYEDYGH